MKILKRISDNVVLILAENITLSSEGATTSTAFYPSLTHANSVVENVTVFPSDFVGGHYSYIFDVWTITAEGSAAQGVKLAQAKSVKNAQINEWRLQANETSFTYEGHHIAADMMSKIDILVTNGEIGNLGALPPNWIGGWKTTVSDVFVPLPDIATWKLFHSALFNQGLTNFNHAQTLKSQLAAAATLDQINAIVW